MLVNNNRPATTNRNIENLTGAREIAILRVSLIMD
jgi:hypothetical protein